ncbi:MAG: amidohydrolase family protein [Alphaproteobacteria bacterium]|jgi:aminocarboxymuconate-semialdehyde decarboxylase|nr:amidohydrolase family protein [Alphaproteobacteria bacterium]
MIIDIHAHYLPRTILDAVISGQRSFPSLSMLADGDTARFHFKGSEPTRPVMGNLRGTEHRLAWMREQGLDRQLVGGWLDAFGYQMPADEGADWSRFQNEEMQRATAAHDELIPLATVPMQDGKQAVRVLEEAMAGGFHGAMIGTQPKGDHGGLDEPGLDPFWEAAAASGAVIFIHPMFGSDDQRLSDYGMMNAVGRVTDTTVAVSRLLFAGHLLRHPELKVVVATGGAALPFMLGRLARNHEVHPGQYADPVAGFHQLYFDSIVFQPTALRFLCDLVGTDRVLLGSDYPFPIGDMTPTRVIRESGYDEAAMTAMLGGNATTLFRL